ncbi:hypothetical protein JCM14469_26000 [Desulfatiferula olefinivorans]
MNDSMERTRPSMVWRVSQLTGGIAIIALFMMVLAPAMDDKPYVKQLVDYIEYRNIDAAALFYTEIEEFSDAGVFMNNSRRYNPDGSGTH